jgi:hypothetical protein
MAGYMHPAQHARPQRRGDVRCDPVHRGQDPERVEHDVLTKRPMRGSVLGTALLLMLAALACKKSGGDQASPAAAGSASAAPAAAGSNPRLAALIEAALACKWESWGLDTSCSAYDACFDSDLVKDGKADATLVALIEDARPAARWLGAEILRVHGKAYRESPDLARRVLAAARAEREMAVLRSLGEAAGAIDVTKTGLQKEVEALGRTHPETVLRAALVKRAQMANPAPLFDFTVTLAETDPVAEVRIAALDAFWVGTPDGKQTRVCGLWFDRAKADRDEGVASAAAKELFFPGSFSCDAHWDALLGLIDARAAAGTADDWSWVTALGHLYDGRHATQAQKSRALAILRTLLANPENSGNARSQCLDKLVRLVPAEAGALAAKYQNDPDASVKASAKRALEKR